MSPLRAMESRAAVRSKRRILRSAIEAMEARLLLSSSASTGVQSLAAASAVSTTQIVVNTAQDQTDPAGSKTVSLRDAVEFADHSSGPVSISFDATVFASHQMITLVERELELRGNTEPITIAGPAAGLTLSGNGVSRILRVDGGVTASVTGITFAYAQSNYDYNGGGAIINSGNLTITGSSITGNIAPVGGAIENLGNLLVRNSNISSNSSDSAGGIDNSGSLAIQNCVVSLNQAVDGNGGGIRSSGPLTVVDSTISGNTDTYGNGGGVYSSGTATISSSTISGNSTHPGSNQVYSSYGAGVSNTGHITITNSTISGNSTDGNGGGISNTNGGNAQLFDSTISDNTAFYGGGIFNQAGDTLTIANSIDAANQLFNANAAQPDVAGDVSSSGHNLVGIADGSSGWIKSDFQGSKAFPINPRLSPLDFFGGPTQTQYPLTGSLAKLAGSAALIPPGVTTDQRGFARIVNGAVDIGSVELQHFATPVVTPAGRQNVTAGDPASIALGTFADPGGTGPFHVIVDWGDGSAHTYFNLNSVGSLGNHGHTFVKTGLLTVAIFVRDARGDLSQPKGFPVFAATQPLLKFVVNTTSSQTHATASGTVSLADAIDRANQRYGPVTISFDPVVFAKTQTIAIPEFPLHLQDNVFAPVVIVGPSAGVILMGDVAHSSAVLQIDQGVNLKMSNVTVSGGGDDGIQSNGTLSLTHCTISNNIGLYGGGINSFGSLTITGSTITGNTANGVQGAPPGYSGGVGGAIYSEGDLTISNSTISGNTSNSPVGNDAAIYNFSGALIVADSTISGNTGSGFENIGLSGSITNTRIMDNSNWGGYAINMRITGCEIAGNPGGGLVLYNSALSNCTISGNGSLGGIIGGISARGNVAITNCTIANNSTSVNGGGISVDVSSEVSIYDSTISSNTGGGIFGSPADYEGNPAAIIRLANTIVAGNINPIGGDWADVSGVFSSLGFNLIGQTDGSSGWVKSDLTGTAAHPLVAKLSPVGPNGGPTPTMVPLAGSPALNHGSNALIPAGVTHDQRGMPRIAHGIVDIGAVEVQSG